MLMQLISAVIAGVAPIAKATFAGQQPDGNSGGGDDDASTSGAKKPKEVIHSLPWGGLLRRPKGSSYWPGQWLITGTLPGHSHAIGGASSTGHMG